MSLYGQNVGGALEITDDGRVLRVTHEHIGAPPEPGGVRKRILDPRSTVASETWRAAPADSPGARLLAPLSLVPELPHERYPQIIGCGGGACSSVPVEDLSAGQRQRIGDFWSDFQRGFATVDRGVLDPLWQAVRPIVPGGALIDQLHRARMSAMYGDEGAGAARGVAERAITSAQELTRRARKGDPAAQQQIAALKVAAAAGQPAARKTWAVIVAVSRDDDARIAAPSSTAPSSSFGGGGFASPFGAASFG